MPPCGAGATNVNLRTLDFCLASRKLKMAPIDDNEIPRVEALGRKAPSPLLNSDRGGAIPIPLQDPLAAREAARP